MRKVILVLFTFAIIAICNSEKTSIPLSKILGNNVDKSSICENRGHAAVTYNITRKNSEMEVIDYPDSTVVVYFENEMETGTIMRCERCGMWLDVPKMNPRKYKVLWRRELALPDSLEENAKGDSLDQKEVVK